MARGRMLNKTISLSEKFAAMPDDTCRLVATWIIPHLDKAGVFYADPRIVKSQVLPMLDVSVDAVHDCINAMASIGLVKLFHANGKVWQVWRGFADNQKGYHADREATEYPQPPADAGEYLECLPDNSGSDRTNSGNLRTNSGSDRSNSDNCRKNSSEEKGKEVEGKGREGEIRASAPPVITQTQTAEFIEPTVAPSTATTFEAKSPPMPEVQLARSRNLLFDAIAEVTASDTHLLGSRIGKVTAEFSKIGATPDQVRKVAAWYSANDWRGKKGEKLTFEILKEVWQQGCRGSPVVATNRPTSRAAQINYSDEERDKTREQAHQRIEERTAKKAAEVKA